MTDLLVKKLTTQLKAGFRSEVHVVYFLVNLRKILELKQDPNKYSYLKFYCDWVLHTRLDRNRIAKQILNQLSRAHADQIRDENSILNNKVRKILNLDFFYDELLVFLDEYSIPSFKKEPEDWLKFLYLYTKEVEGSSLVINVEGNSVIRKVSIAVETSDKAIEGLKFFKISWHILGSNNETGKFYIINGF